MEKQRIVDLVPEHLREQLLQEVKELLAETENSGDDKILQDIKAWGESKSKFQNIKK